MRHATESIYTYNATFRTFVRQVSTPVVLMRCAPIKYMALTFCNLLILTHTQSLASRSAMTAHACPIILSIPLVRVREYCITRCTYIYRDINVQVYTPDNQSHARCLCTPLTPIAAACMIISWCGAAKVKRCGIYGGCHTCHTASTALAWGFNILWGEEVLCGGLLPSNLHNPSLLVH